VCEDDDDGETAVGRGKAQKEEKEAKQKEEKEAKQKQSAPPVERIGQTEIISLNALIQNLNDPKSFFDWIKKSFNAASLQDIPKVCFEQCMTLLNAKIKYLRSEERGVA
jgi:acetyl-CoA carboxylase carboxyltransferase component